MATETKIILFFPLNSPGHINSSLGIADKLKRDYAYRTIFLIVGDAIGTSIQDHGHELVTLEEVQIHEDYEISDDDDTFKPIDEERKIRLGRKKKQFRGCHKWPQIINRHKYLIRLPPLESFIACSKFFEEVMCREAIENHDNYVKALESINPDLIVVDSYYVPPCVVNWKRCPWVRLFSANPLQLFSPNSPEGIMPAPMNGFKLLTKQGREKLRKDDPQAWKAMLSEWKEANEVIIKALGKANAAYEKFLIENNCEPLQPGKQAHDSPYINLYMYPKEIDYDQDDDLFKLNPRWFRCDSLMRMRVEQLVDSSEAKFWTDKYSKAKEGKKNSIYFSLGSLASGDAKLMQSYINILKEDQDRLYVVSKGVNGDRYELDSNNMIGANYIPQTLFLANVDLAIVHGGNNSVTECLYYGLPMIVLPVFADQLDNAQRIEDFKLGTRLDAFNLNKDAILGAVDNILLNQELRSRCRKIGEKMQARDEARKASLILRKLTEEGSLDEEFIDKCRNGCDDVQN